MVTSRRMGRGGEGHNLSQRDWSCFPNDASRCFSAECFLANYDVQDVSLTMPLGESFVANHTDGASPYFAVQ